MATPTSPAGPLAPRERSRLPDVLRGVAVLGIFAMNVQAFSDVMASYLNPQVHGPLTGAGWLVWLVQHVFFEMKFITLFAVLFGAGIVLAADREVASGRDPTRSHRRRILVLFAIGMVHAYGVWYGDILVSYAVCGLVAYAFRACRNRVLLAWAAVFLAVPVGVTLVTGATFRHWPTDVRADVVRSWQPTPAEIAAEVEAYRGGWVAQNAARWPASLDMQVGSLPFLHGWRVLGSMLVGMVLARLGFLTGQVDRGAWVRWVVVAAPVGMLLTGWGVVLHERRGWDVTWSLFAGMLPNYIGSLFLAAAYLGAVGWAVQAGVWPRVQVWMAAVGRMAFTNYLGQSAIGVLLFYGTGLGWFGALGRLETVPVVLGVWVFQVVFSVWWLGRFRFGPVEWFWRRLTYGRAP
jgi:uncharacterized protein